MARIYRVMALDAYDLSETEYEVERFTDKEDAELCVEELKFENRQLIYEMRDAGHETFYFIKEV